MKTTRADRRARGARLGAGSLLWETAGDPRGLLTGSTAGILQLMLPGLGAGVTDHSDFFEDPFDRIFRSIPPIWASIFAEDDEQGDRVGRMIRGFHPDIKGSDHTGERYHALDPDVFWWAHATFTWEFFRARELFFPVPLHRSQKVRMYAETVTLVPPIRCQRPLCAPYARRLRGAFRGDLPRGTGDHADGGLGAQSGVEPRNPGGSVPPAGPLALLNGLANQLGAELLHTIVYGSMPDVVRRRFDFEWTHADRLCFASVCAGLRALDPVIRRGALSELYPEGTPRLAPGSRDKVIISGPNPRQHRRTRSAPTAACASQKAR